uniref:Ig-like domain-containing protein n=1 Tax=Chelydra serpentina TaxID=8475 RepID=A0A8C3TF94_CHESE
MGIERQLCSISFLTYLFLPAFLDARTTKSQAIQLTGMVGGSVVFPFKVPPWVPVETIVWNSITTLATFTPMKGKPAAVNVLDKRYIGRLRFLDHTYSLVISNLSMLDRGTYRAQINTEFTTTVTEYLLRVYKKIPPAIAIHSGEGICNVTLTCTTREGGGDIAYSWHQPGKSHVLSTEPILRITQKPADGFLNYTCTVHSAGSKNASMVSLSEHCHGQGQYSHPQLSTFAREVCASSLRESGLKLHFRVSCHSPLPPSPSVILTTTLLSLVNAEERKKTFIPPSDFA